MTRWTINPETLYLDAEDGDASMSRRFTGEEWRAQEWPPCPVCGTTICVSSIDAQTSQDAQPVYVMGRWQCPNRCDPRSALRTPEGTTP